MTALDPENLRRARNIPIIFFQRLKNEVLLEFRARVAQVAPPGLAQDRIRIFLFLEAMIECLVVEMIQQSRRENRFRLVRLGSQDNDALDQVAEFADVSRP